MISIDLKADETRDSRIFQIRKSECIKEDFDENLKCERFVRQEYVLIFPVPMNKQNLLVCWFQMHEMQEILFKNVY